MTSHHAHTPNPAALLVAPQPLARDEPHPYGASLDVLVRLEAQPGSVVARTRDGFELHVKTRAFAHPSDPAIFTTGALTLRLWPRTDSSGLLISSTQAYRITPLERAALEEAEPDRFSVRGRLIRHLPTRRSAVVLVRRNQRGNLRREFYLTLALTNRINRHLARHASSDDGPPGAALRFDGQLENGRLVVRTITPIMLGEPKPIKRRPQAYS